MVERAQVAKVDEVEPEIHRRLNILAADDHPTNLRVVELILAQIGADITAVENGAEAVTAFKVNEYDLVLMDMQMPVLDGLSAVRQIRAWEAGRGQARTPVLMLTANAMAAHRAASEAAGADGHVAKPVTSEALIHAIASALEPGAEPAKAAGAADSGGSFGQVGGLA